MNTNTKAMQVTFTQENSLLHVSGITERAIAQGTFVTHKMKNTLFTFFCATSLIASAETPSLPTPNCHVSSESSSKTTAASPFAAIHVLDDLSGVELMDKHGIVETSAADLLVLRVPVLGLRKVVMVQHDIVDEDGQDNDPAMLCFQPCPHQPPPVPVLRGSITAMQKIKAEYDADRADFQRKLQAYSQAMGVEIDTFITKVTTQQMEAAARFDRIRVDEHNGRDWNHSDVANAIVTGVKKLPTGPALRVLVLNTDMEDLPTKGQPRTKAFTTEELPPDIIVVFTNTSRKPDTSPLLNGLTNTRHHADSMSAAMTLIASWLAHPELAHPLSAVAR